MKYLNCLLNYEYLKRVINNSFENSCNASVKKIKHQSDLCHCYTIRRSL